MFDFGPTDWSSSGLDKVHDSYNNVTNFLVHVF